MNNKTPQQTHPPTKIDILNKLLVDKLLDNSIIKIKNYFFKKYLVIFNRIYQKRLRFCLFFSKPLCCEYLFIIQYIIKWYYSFYLCFAKKYNHKNIHG